MADNRSVPYDLASLKKLTLGEIKNILLPPLPASDSLPETPPYSLGQATLQNIALCLQNYAVEAVADECLKFVLNIRNINCEFGRGQLGEKFLQLSAIVNFYLGNHIEAAKSAGILGNVYYAANYAETNVLSLRFNLFAGKAYLKCGNTAKACHHFQKYTDTNGAHLHREWRWVTTTLQHLAEYNSSDTMTSDKKRKLAAESAVAATRELFGELIPAPYTFSASTAQEAILELSRLLTERETLSKKVQALRDSYRNEDKKPTELESFELEYQHAKAWRIGFTDTDTVINNLNNEMLVQQMTLSDIHLCLTAGVSKAKQLFFRHPNIISAKLENCSQFLLFAQYNPYSDSSIGELLLNFTSGTERVRIFSMIYPRYDELTKIPFSGIDDRAKFKIDKTEFEAAFKEMTRLTPSKKTVSTLKIPATLFAALQMDVTVTEEQMAKSAFGRGHKR